MIKPRVAMVSLSPLATGGIETHLLQIFHGLGKEFEFHILGSLGEPFRMLAGDLGVKCASIPSAGKADPMAVLRLWKEFRARGIAMVHTHDTRGGLLGRVAARAARIPAVHTVHTPSFFLPSSPRVVGMYRLAERALGRAASDRMVFVSKTIRQLYLDGRLVEPEKARLIPNGLELEWLEPVRHILREGDDVRFLYVGRMAREKGIGNLADAFGITAARIPSVRLIAVGEGPQKEELARTAEREGWRNRLELTGWLVRRRIRQMMRSADVFVLPSDFESFSYTLLEAMASGLACIATDVGGNRDLVEPERTGILVPRGNVLRLADAMVRMANDGPSRIAMGREGATCAREYTVERMIRATRSLYTEVISRNSPEGKA
jgi:glycosyltransferase involved in cell wall biosynthesis